MSDDFQYRMMFVAGREPVSFRDAAHNLARSHLSAGAWSPVETEDVATRCLAFGPVDPRWLWVGDTTGSTEYSDYVAYRALTLRLSTLAPTINVCMSDDCCVHIELYERGELLDVVGTGEVPFGGVQEGTRERLAGHPERWCSMLASGTDPDAFEAFFVWEGFSRMRAPPALARTIEMFGWPPGLSATGYSLDWEGLFTKYDPEELGWPPEAFQESYWSDGESPLIVAEEEEWEMHQGPSL